MIFIIRKNVKFNVLLLATKQQEKSFSFKKFVIIKKRVTVALQISFINNK